MKVQEAAFEIRAILTQSGRQILNDPDHFEKILIGSSSGTHEEIAALTHALREGIPSELAQISSAGFNAPLVSSYVARLGEKYRLSEDIARWSTVAWAKALNVLPPSLNKASADQGVAAPQIARFARNRASAAFRIRSKYGILLAIALTVSFSIGVAAVALRHTITNRRAQQVKSGEQQVKPDTQRAVSLRLDNSVNECDMLAGDANDPERKSAGVEDQNIQSARAIEVCSGAVKTDQENRRLLFELGRALWTGRRFEEAIEMFLKAAELGHGGALAYLGDATLYGVAGLEADPDAAKNLYQRAAEAGFKPAATIAAGIVPGVEPLEKPDESAEALPQPEFHYPKTVESFAKGGSEFDGTFPRGGALAYTASLLNGVSSQCPDALPKGTDPAALFERAIQSRFSPTELMTVGQLESAGEFDPIIQAGLDDGYAFAASRGCTSHETATFIKTAIDFFD